MKLNERSNSRRQLLKWFAASPLLALPGLAGLAAQTSTRVPQVRPDPMIWAPGDLQDKALAGQLAQELAALGVADSSAFYDNAAGRWGSLILKEPLIPGDGVGNTLRWSGLAERTDSQVRQEVWARLNQYLERHQKELRIDRSELGSPTINVLEGGALVQVVSPRRVGGILVRDSVMGAVVRHGNLVLLGFQNWAPAFASTEPSLSPEQAKEAQTRLEAILGETVPLPLAADLPRLRARLKPHLKRSAVREAVQVLSCRGNLAAVFISLLTGTLGSRPHQEFEEAVSCTDVSTAPSSRVTVASMPRSSR